MAAPSSDQIPDSGGSGPVASGPRGNLALYRRYRSATFAEVIGQEHVTQPLSVALRAHRINHAYLFSGPRGCGKTSSARILARSLNCDQGPTPTPCGVCNSCRELAPNGPGSIDVIEIDAASHNGVDDARDLRERAYYTPARDRFKVYIIDEAHMVTSHAFNALLKVVEEPPDHLVFIFATTEPDKVLQTIRSRTHHYPFRLVAPSVLRAHLERIAAAERVAVEPAVYPLVVRAGAGSVRDALSLLDQLFAGADEGGVTYQRAVALLGVTDAALIDDMIDALAVGDAGSVYGTVDRVIEAGHEPRRFATDLLDRLRDLLILDAVPDAQAKGLLDAPVDALERMRDQAARIGVSAAARYAEIVHTALIEMRGTTAPRLLLELVCARMLLPDASNDSSALLQRLERLERMQSLQVTERAAPAGQPGSPSAASSAPTAPSRASRAGSSSSAAPSGPLSGGSSPASAASAPPSGASSAMAAAPSPPSADAASTPAPIVSASDGPSSADPIAPAAGGGLDVTAVRALWPQVLDAVRATSRTTRALMDSAQVAELDGYNLRLVMATAPLVKMLGEPRNADVVTAALAGLLPGTWTMQVEVGTDINAAPVLPPAVAPPADPPAVAPPADPPAEEPAAAAPPSPAASAAAEPSAVEPSPAGRAVASAPEPVAPAPPAPSSMAARKPKTSVPTEAAPTAAGTPGSGSDGGWPTVATIPSAPEPAAPSAPTAPTGRAARATAAGGSSRGRRGAVNGTSARGSRADETPPDDDPGDYPDEDPEASSGPGQPQDPEALALDLLKNGLGARSVED